MSYRLIVVTGCMRSGTTLLHRLVSTSPDAGPMLSPARFVVEQFEAYRRYRRKERLFIDDYFPSLEAFAAHVKAGVESVLTSAWEMSGRPPALVVKSADFSFLLPLVAEILPEARFVISVREPKDTITSMLKVGNRRRQEGLRYGLGAGARDIKRLCKTYNGSYLATLRAMRSSPDPLSSRIAFVKYEDVVADPGAALAPVWRLCGIAAGSANLEDLPEANDRVEKLTHRHWRSFLTDLTARAVSRTSVGSHRTELDPAEARTIDWRCRRVRRTFAYA